jgi:hypothetical protein
LGAETFFANLIQIRIWRRIVKHGFFGAGIGAESGQRDFGATRQSAHVLVRKRFMK